MQEDQITIIPEVDLFRKSEVNRNQANTRAFVLNEVAPKGNGSAERLNEIVDFLNVEDSKRYKRTSISTFCNIYAYDYAYLAGAYLPRVWWTEKAIQKRDFKTKRYGKNIVELNANALYRWFKQHSSDFGWKECDNMETAQGFANDGFAVIAVAANKKSYRSGHITAIVPETINRKCKRSLNGNMIAPLQSQAGAVNQSYFTSAWWGNMKPVKFYVNISATVTA